MNNARPWEAKTGFSPKEGVGSRRGEMAKEQIMSGFGGCSEHILRRFWPEREPESRDRRKRHGAIWRYGLCGGLQHKKEHCSRTTSKVRREKWGPAPK